MANRTSPSQETTRPMQVGDISFMLDRLGEDCSPLQFLRELTQNSLEAIQRLPDKKGDVIWDVDWNTYDLTGMFKLCIRDTGDAMTGEEMIQYINSLSSSVNVLSSTGNYGVGAKTCGCTLYSLRWTNGKALPK